MTIDNESQKVGMTIIRQEQTRFQSEDDMNRKLEQEIDKRI